MKVEKTIYLVTHGEKHSGLVKPEEENSGPNPGMTEEGKERVAALKPNLDELLPCGPAVIHCGTGRRHIDTLEALGFPTTSQNRPLYSDLWGSPASLERIGGEKIIIFADGTITDWEHYKTTKHLGKEVISRVIAGLDNNSLICSGRPVPARLGRRPEECESGAIYALHVMDDGSIQIELLVSGVNLSDGAEGAKV